MSQPLIRHPTCTRGTAAWSWPRRVVNRDRAQRTKACAPLVGSLWTRAWGDLLRAGYWMGYFAARSAPLGTVPA